MKYVFKNALAVTMDEKAQVLDSCDVLIKNDLIGKVGNLTRQDTCEAEIIDASGKLLMPGLINSHTHVPMTLLRNYADDLNLQTWLFEHIFPVEARLKGDDIYWATLLGIMEMLSFGTTSFIDMYYFMNHLAKAAAKSGIRALLSRGMTNSESGTDFSEDKALNESIEFCKEWNGACNGRIMCAFAPHAIYTCSPDYIKAIRDAAIKYGVPVHVHLDETLTEHEDSIKNYNKTPTRHLYDLGLFEQKTIAAHCVWVTQEDLALLKEKDVTFVHNPTSNLKLASGVAPVPGALSLGINVALGTDGASSNNNLNLFEEIHLASIIHKGTSRDPLLVTAEDALKMATVNGAKALGMDNLGVIKEGNKADLILLDISKPHYKPMHNTVSALAYSSLGSDVYLTMVDGRILYRDGSFLTIDKEEVYFNINRICQRLFNGVK